MNLNVKRKVGEINLKPSEFLLPVFEAIVNSIHAIEESDNKKGLIKVTITRDKSQTSLPFDGEEEYNPIKSFIIDDNGVGFNVENFKAFNDAYTEHKIEKGGKGVGRFTILRAFKKVNVASTYKENGDISERSFDFDVANEVSEIIKPKKSESKSTGSKITIENYLTEFRQKSAVSRDYIAEKIVEHCLIYFISDSMPDLILKEEDDEKGILLTDIFKNFIAIDSKPETIKEKEETFNLYFIHRYKNKGSHKISFCGHNREVENVQVRNIIPNLSSHLSDDKGNYFLSVYVIGDYLNNNVIEARNAFKFPKKSSEKDVFQKFSLEELVDLVRVQIEKKYLDDITKIEEGKNEMIKKFILDDGGIEYRHLLGNPEYFKTISPNVSVETLDSELHRVNYHLEKEHKVRVNSVLNTKKIDDHEEFEKELKQIINEEHKFSQSKLANYVIRRKVIIKIFNKFLGFGTDEKYKLEQDLHNIIFPMGEDSDSIPYANHNLWLLDEKLTFHTYVASDKKIKSMPVVTSDSKKEPDLAIFNMRYAFSIDDKFQSVVIVEFKKPGRILTGDDRNVDNQIKKYYEDLSKSSAKDYKGRLINLKKETPKFGYVICEINNDLDEYLTGLGGFRKTSSGSLYKYLDNINLYIEVSTYQSMLDNVETRHKAFFNQLGVDYL
jgi:hypothetical protein